MGIALLLATLLSMPLVTEAQVNMLYPLISHPQVALADWGDDDDDDDDHHWGWKGKAHGWNSFWGGSKSSGYNSRFQDLKTQAKGRCQRLKDTAITTCSLQNDSRVQQKQSQVISALQTVKATSKQGLSQACSALNQQSQSLSQEFDQFIRRCVDARKSCATYCGEIGKELEDLKDDVSNRYKYDHLKDDIAHLQQQTVEPTLQTCSALSQKTHQAEAEKSNWRNVQGQTSQCQLATTDQPNQKTAENDKTLNTVREDMTDELLNEFANVKQVSSASPVTFLKSEKSTSKNKESAQRKPSPSATSEASLSARKAMITSHQFHSLVADMMAMQPTQAVAPSEEQGKADPSLKNELQKQSKTDHIARHARISSGVKKTSDSNTEPRSVAGVQGRSLQQRSYPDGITGSYGPSVWQKVSQRYRAQSKNLTP